VVVTNIRALVVDYGGVLTSPLQDTMSAWCESDGIDLADFRNAMTNWFGAEYAAEAAVNPIHALERGEMDVPDFERELAERLQTRDGQPVEAVGLLSRMFSGFDLETSMFTALRHAKAAGVTTALLSNSWGLDYPREGWDELFDVVVISGEVKMRKPDHGIYQLMIERLGLVAGQCVFVDDLMPNIRAAIEVGMVGIHHVTPQQTLDELEALLNVPLRG
jgi:epoxide hydrolase-like predicted phosphatase